MVLISHTRFSISFLQEIGGNNENKTTQRLLFKTTVALIKNLNDYKKRFLNISVLVCKGGTKLQTGRLKQQRCVVLQFWRLEVQTLGASRIGSF